MLVTVPDTKRPPFPVLNTTAQSEKISFWNVQSDNFLKKIVESLVGMCNQNDLLIWEIVEKQVHHLRCRVVKTCFLDLRPSTSQVQQAVSTRFTSRLHCSICFSSARRTDNHCETRVYSRADCFHLYWGKTNRVLSWPQTGGKMRVLMQKSRKEEHPPRKLEENDALRTLRQLIPSWYPLMVDKHCLKQAEDPTSIKNSCKYNSSDLHNLSESL